MAQERMDDWWEYAKELAKAERELQIGHWVRISIEYRDEAGDTVRLHSYDLPRELHERYRWVVRWREARLQCLYPRKHIHTYYSYYDKRTGLRTGFNSCLSRLSTAKAQITIAERKEKEYLEYQRRKSYGIGSQNPFCGDGSQTGKTYLTNQKQKDYDQSGIDKAVESQQL